MPLSDDTRQLLDMVLQKVHDEGFSIFGCYARQEPEVEIIDFSAPPRSRAKMADMVGAWLDLLDDHSVPTEELEPQPSPPKIYHA